MNLEYKTAIITGGSRGIGKAIALHLASLGADIAINYNSNAEAAYKVVEEIKSMGRKAVAIKTNVGQEDQVEEFVEKVLEEFQCVDILVNNAGITKDNLLLRMKEEEWDEVLTTNLKGAFLMTKKVLRKMIKNRRGKIINITSIVGAIGNAGQTNYSASKAGLIGFTKSVAKEVAARGIQVNAIAPGFIQTEMTQALPEPVKNELIAAIPSKKLGKPEDIAYLAGYLSSELSDYITGQIIHVDGGMYM